MSFIEQLGQQTASSTANAGLGALMGIALEKHNDARQIRQATALQNLDIAGQQKMMQSQYDMQMRMWNETNYAAQMAQLQKAGLNPALLYGMKGGGSVTTGNQQATVSQGHTSQNPGEVQGLMGLTLQNANMNAQRQLTEAQTKNVEADTKKKLEGDIPNVQMQTQSLSQGIENQKAVKLLTEADTALKQNELAFNKRTFDDRAETIFENAQTAMELAMQAERQTYIDRATADAKIKTIRTESIQKILEVALLGEQTKLTREQIEKVKSDIEVNKAEIQKIATDIDQNWVKLSQSDKELTLKNIETNFRTKFPGITQVTGKVLNDWIQSVYDMFNQKRP